GDGKPGDQPGSAGMQGNCLFRRQRRKLDAPQRVLCGLDLQGRATLGMGHGRAGSQPLGSFAVMRLRVSLTIMTLGFCVVGSLAGCSLIATLPGLTAGAATSSVTGNPALGLTVAIATN